MIPTKLQFTKVSRPLVSYLVYTAAHTYPVFLFTGEIVQVQLPSAVTNQSQQSRSL